MTAAVTFNYSTFIVRYPEFAAVSEALLSAYFDEAGLYCANEESNPAFSITLGSTTQLAMFLNMLTGHLAWLNAPRDANGMPATTGKPASPIVGRISSASEGSVSVQTENSYEPGTPQWYQQTTYGSAYWSASAMYRTMQYAANPTMIVNSLFPFRARY